MLNEHQCEWCGYKAYIKIHADQMFDNRIIVRDRYCCEEHLEKTERLMSLDGFKGWQVIRSSNGDF
jgi:hypothetical protein